MDSSDDEKSRGSDSPNDNNGSSILKEEDRPGRILLRPWLESVLEMGNIQGLQWIDADKTMFKVPWKHRSKKDWSTRHSSVFLEWAKNTGRWTKGDPAPNYAQLKTRLRCAFNKAPDIEEMKGHHFQQGEEPYKVYRFKSKKECWTMKQNNLVARNAAKHNKIHFFGRNNNSNTTIQWGIKKERLEEEPHVEEQEAHYYSNGNSEQKVLSFKEHMEELKSDIKGDSEVEDKNVLSTDQRESKFTPSVIPLTVEMFSSSISDESDAENEGSRRSKGRGRPSNSRSQKQQDPDQTAPQHLPLKQQNDFASYQPHIPTSTHNNTANGKLNDERGNLDFFQVASLFVEASEILQNGKDASLKVQSETNRSIKQEVPESVDSEGEADRSEESISNIKESGKEKHIIIKSLESSAILNTLPKLSSPATNYPPNLPKLDLHPSLRSCNMLSMDSKVGNQIFQQLTKIRLNSNNVPHQVGISRPKLRFPPPPGAPSLPQVVTPLTISRSNPNATSRFLIFSNSSFLSNLSSPVFSVARPCNTENMKIVLGKIQTPPILKDSGFNSQSIPSSLIMLSSAAEAAESSTIQQNSLSNISLNRVPGAVVSMDNAVPSQDIGTAIAENKSNESQNAIGTQDMIVISAVDKSDDSDVVMENDIAEPESVSMETETTVDGEVLSSSSLDSQDEALDLSSAATKHIEPQGTSVKEQSMQDDISDKLEIDESSSNSNVKEDVIGCKKFVADDDDGIDVVSHLNEAGSTLREVEESISADPKLLRSLRNVLDMLRMCTAELNQKQKSIKSQQDILHLRTRLLESEEEKMQLKVQYFGISRKKEDSSLIDSRHEYYGSGDNRASFVRDVARDGRSSASIIPILADKTSEQTATMMMNKSGAPYNATFPQRTVLSFSPSNSIKVTVAPSQPVIPLTLTSASRSPKPIRVINLGKPPEPCGMGVVHPMQQQPRPATTPAFSHANGIRASCPPKSADLTGVAPSLSPSSSPIILNIQNPFANMKVLKINRTPSTEGMASSSFPVATALCPPTLITSSAKSKSSETKTDDDVIAIKNQDLRDVSSTNQKHKQRDGVTSEEEESTTSKRFKFDEKEENQTLKCYDEFKIKNKYLNSNHHK